MTEIAVIGVDSFWELEDQLRSLAGVLHTSVGYTGGTSSRPTYHTKHDHTEAVRIMFDPRRVTYEELLARALQIIKSLGMTPTIFYADAAEHRAAQDAALHYDGTLHMAPMTQFYEAETYHQQFLARLRGESIANWQPFATNLHTIGQTEYN